MQYMILALEDADAFEAREDDRAEAYWSSWRGYIDALTTSGVLVGAGGICTSIPILIPEGSMSMHERCCSGRSESRRHP